MRIARLVLPIAAALAVAATAAANNPPSGSYSWVQPDAAAVVNPFAQMPNWLVIAPTTRTIVQAPVLTTYRWAQPGGAPVHVPYGQPSFL